MIRTSWLVMSLAVVAMLPVQSASAATVEMNDGRELVGEITSDPGANVVQLSVQDGDMEMTLHLKRAEIRSIDYSQTKEERLADDLNERRAELLASDSARPAELWQLAVGYREAGLDSSARDMAELVVLADRHHAEARDLLGFKRYNGVWMRPDEIAAAQGLVRYAGRWMSWAEVEAEREREALAAAERAERREERQQRREEREAARRARAVDPIASSPVYTYRSGWSGRWLPGYGYGYGYGYPGYAVRPGVGVGHYRRYSSGYTGGFGGFVTVGGSSGSSRWRVGLTW